MIKSLSTQFLRNILAASGNGGTQILSGSDFEVRGKLINDGHDPEVYLMDFKVKNQSKPIIKFQKSPYSRMRFKNMEMNRKTVRTKFGSTTHTGQRSQSKKDTTRGPSLYTRMFATPFTDAQIEDVYVS
ncbi:hypothetical protein KL930_005390 [Ogataea haglerorum]|uniref:Uncharacterized protein n=2 Tax=Ogataea haglerorum TaxID=1937702 RepID=A0AAN6D1C3_9ASCO|nr:hypothetical protein KL950_005395 [Ogataea haglerorum]KAG7702143.1 hypothetical protein KL914_005383 [Ogataea haglerorum]KAG7723769.1 hypothetical protein KL933_005381 [Ogataea haglerorum]KAG7735757.1 hypothetical protein KL923_005383 [Ogataea haglerorum]KAG7761622.1 hypothetical protein KL946_005377 [Ogataea haglerorum]